VLAGAVTGSITANPRSFVLPDGRLAFNKLLRGFARFRRGVLVVFDRRKPKRVARPRFSDTKTPKGRSVRLLRA
jgi:hypothetical protein